jgi:hypothetical protein
MRWGGYSKRQRETDAKRERKRERERERDKWQRKNDAEKKTLREETTGGTKAQATKRTATAWYAS